MDDLNLSRSGNEQVDPALDEIEDAVRSVGGGEDFVILERADECWIQYDGREFEHRDGERIFRAVLDERVAAAFRAFAAGDDSWKDGWSWRDVTDELHRESVTGRRSMLLVVLGLAVLLGLSAGGMLVALGVL